VAASPAAARSTQTVGFKTHLHAVSDFSTTTPACTPTGLLLDCNHFLTSGQGVFSGDVIGKVIFTSDCSAQTDGTAVCRDEKDTVTGTVRGCGDGTFSYKADGVIRTFDADKGGFVGDEAISVIPGSGSSDLKGLAGGGRGNFVLYLDGSIDADYAGTVTCASRPHPSHHPGAKSPRKRGCRGRVGRPGGRRGGGGTGGCRQRA
jgi:hypothetical protein